MKQSNFSLRLSAKDRALLSEAAAFEEISPGEFARRAIEERVGRLLVIQEKVKIKKDTSRRAELLPTR